jgi:hypothetical protein
MIEVPFRPDYPIDQDDGIAVALVELSSYVNGRVAVHHTNQQIMKNSVQLLFGAGLLVFSIACTTNSAATKGSGELTGVWKETGFDLDTTIAKDKSGMLAFLLALSEMGGERLSTFTGTEMIVKDSTGKVVRREPCVLQDSLMIFGSDTEWVRWKTADAFTAYSHGVSVSYERLPEAAK